MPSAARVTEVEAVPVSAGMSQSTRYIVPGGVVEVAERQPLLLLVSDDAQRGVRRFEAVQEDRLAGFVRVVVVALSQPAGQHAVVETSALHVDRVQVVEAGDRRGDLAGVAEPAQFDRHGLGVFVVGGFHDRARQEQVLDVETLAVLFLFDGAERTRAAHADRFTAVIPVFRMKSVISQHLVVGVFLA